jgi:predicted DNA-binding transcriptional regulator AlpA
MSEKFSQGPHDPYLDQFLTRSELAAERRVSVDTIDRMVKRGELPPPQKLSPRRQGWRRRNVQPIDNDLGAAWLLRGPQRPRKSAA